MSSDLLVWPLLSFIVFLVCVESWFSWRFLRTLKREFPRLWELSGRRTIWTDSDLISAWPTIRFLWYREYKAIGTPAEIEFCERHRARVTFSWAIAGISVAAFFLVLMGAAQLRQ